MQRGGIDLGAGQAAAEHREALDRSPAGGVGGGEQILALGDELAEALAVTPALAELADRLQLVVVWACDRHLRL